MANGVVDMVNGPTGDPMYWLIPIGLVLGCIVVYLFELIKRSMHPGSSRDLYKALTEAAVLNAAVEKKLRIPINGANNVFEFWSGGLMFVQAVKNEQNSQDYLAKTYEMLSLVCALLLTVGVTFYTADESGSDNKLFGLVCCVANCALWMGTLSSAFFTVVLNSCENDEQATHLVRLYGTMLMRVPMMLFVWGSALLFIEFVLYFKVKIDSGFNCTMCLTLCFLIVPLFIHCMHKMGWAAGVVHADAAARNEAPPPTAEEIRAIFAEYAVSKGPNPLALDQEEFVRLLGKRHCGVVTSMQLAFAERLFSAYADAALSELAAAPLTLLPRPAKKKKKKVASHVRIAAAHPQGYQGHQVGKGNTVYNLPLDCA